ncbi:MAG: class I tRNA ligase family protein, partial [Opitutales bacterium]
WWGHRIPVWYCRGNDMDECQLDCKKPVASIEKPAACPACGSKDMVQDEDVLDTWASSWLWPFATMGWPDEQAMQEQDLAAFYPTSVLVTGPDIIFFWVARMIMAGLEFMGEPIDKDQVLDDDEIKRRIPFGDVYFTGIIRDGKGRKMSKSLGNSPEPLDLIAKYGADGLRHGIMSIAPKGQDIRFAEERVEQGRNFCNKLWNVSRFRRMSGEPRDNSSLDAILARIDPRQLDAEDHAILSRLIETLDQVERDHLEYEFNSVLHAIYRFFWSDFCDWYVEVSKAKLRDDDLRETCLAVQDLCLRQTLLLLHPVTPFITEELWQRLGYTDDGSSIQYLDPGEGKDLAQSLAAQGISLDRDAGGEVGAVRDLVTAMRALKAERGLAANKEVAFRFVASDDKASLLERNKDKVLRFVGAVSFDRLEKAPQGAPSAVTDLGTVFLDLASGIDLEAERSRLEKEILKLEKVVASTEARLNNEDFTAKAPPEVIEGARRQFEESQGKLEENRTALAALG